MKIEKGDTLILCIKQRKGQNIFEVKKTSFLFTKKVAEFKSYSDAVGYIMNGVVYAGDENDRF